MNTQVGNYKNKFKNILYPLILILWPLINVNLGVDLTDTTYSLGNYIYFNETAGAWKYATYMANLTGYLLTKVCGGKMLVMNILTGLIISVIALTVYKGLKITVSQNILFFSLLTAESLCWCPVVILYNYLTYLCLTLAAVLIYQAVINNDKRLYYIAGVVLGISFFVRISNATQVMLILAVWLGIVLYKGKGKKAKLIKPTLLCIAGYITGAVAVIVIMTLLSGVSGIVEATDWAIGLFSANEDAGGYSAGGMFKAIFDNYLLYAKWFGIIVAATFAGIAGFSVLRNRLLLIKKIGYCLCVLLLFTWFWRNGVFNTYYRNTGAVFGPGVIMILLQLLILLYTAISKDCERNDKLLAYIAIIIILITPLGSNNHLFTIINNMFFILPVSIYLFMKLIKPYKEEQLMFPIVSMVYAFLILLFVQSALFHMDYVFMDGSSGEERDCLINEDTLFDGMYTNAANAELIHELQDIKVKGLLEDKDGVILYGNIPGAICMLGLPPAISTTWPDLDSYSSDTFEEELNSLNENVAVIVLNKEYDDEKHNILMKYISSFDKTYSGNYITLYN